MKIEYWLKHAELQLNKAGVGSAHLDALILLEDEFGKERSWLLAHQDTEVSNTRSKRLNSKLKKRAKHLPLAFVRGHSEFYGRKFFVNRHTLEPRPESETMIELLLKLPLPARPTIADVGTGSGALGITSALELHTKDVDLYDIDASALSVARHNQALHEVHLHTRKADLLRHYLRPYDVVLANLPYVPDHYQINQAAAMEPKIAIFGGKDGLDIYRRFFSQLHRFHWKPEFILTESLPPQHRDLEEVAKKCGFKLYRSEGFIQVFNPTIY
jgi:release factor glutamine methyltransferase